MIDAAKMGELFGWVQTLLTQLGVWDLMVAGLGLIAIVYVGMFALSQLKR